MPRAASADDVRRRLRLEHRDALGVEAQSQPAFEQRAAHLAGADQHERSGELAQVRVAVETGVLMVRAQ